MMGLMRIACRRVPTWLSVLWYCRRELPLAVDLLDSGHDSAPPFTFTDDSARFPIFGATGADDVGIYANTAPRQTLIEGHRPARAGNAAIHDRFH